MLDTITRDLLLATEEPPEQLDLFDLLPDNSTDERIEVAAQARDPTEEDEGRKFSSELARSLYRKSRDLVLKNFKNKTNGEDIFPDE